MSIRTAILGAALAAQACNGDPATTQSTTTDATTETSTSATSSTASTADSTSLDPTSTSTTDSTSTSTSVTTSTSDTSSTSSTTGATSTGTTTPDPSCGDGVVNGDEECDDGPDNGDDKSCTAACLANVCGDGLLLAGTEACDDGPDNADDHSCTLKCAVNVCGDGLVLAGLEDCDDGAMNDTYAHCLGDCSGPGPFCGDNQRNGPEECDDANQVDTDDCSDDCLAPRIVFVTTATYKGNLGGLAGADAKCVQAAMGGLLPANVQWLAWLSDGATSPASVGRMDTSYNGYYKRRNGEVLAHGWADLTDGSLAKPINITESGVTLPAISQAWSNTNTTGMSAGNTHCKGWTSALLADLGRFGSVGAATAEWTDAAMNNPINCSNGFRLYCFQNSPVP